MSGLVAGARPITLVAFQAEVHRRYHPGPPAECPRHTCTLTGQDTDDVQWVAQRIHQAFHQGESGDCLAVTCVLSRITLQPVGHHA